MAKSKQRHPFLRDPKLRDSILRKRRGIQLEKLPAKFRESMRRRTAIALKAVHGFKGKKMVWGQGKKKGAVELIFEPVIGYKSKSRIEHGSSEVNPLYAYEPADHMYGFKDMIGMPVRFMAYPTTAEIKKSGKLAWLDALRWPQDFVMDARGALGYIGGTASFVGREKKPTMFVQAVEIRAEYFSITSTKYTKDPKSIAEARAIKRRYDGWYKRWMKEVETQCRKLGFERLAILPSNNPFFQKPGVTIQPETRKAFYKTFPERNGFARERLSVPTNEGMKRVTYYAKKLH